MKTLLKFLALAAVVMHIVALAYNADARPRRTGTISTVDGASYGPYFEDFNVVGCVSCHGSPVIHLVGEDHVASGNWVSQDNPGPSTTFTNVGAVPHVSTSGSYPKGFGPTHQQLNNFTAANYISSPTTSLLDGLPTLYVSAIVRVTSSATTQAIIAKDDVAGNRVLFMGLAGGALSCNLWTTVTGLITATNGVTDGRDYYLACLYDGASLKAIVNGVASGPSAGTGNVVTKVLGTTIGHRLAAGLEAPFLGTISEVYATTTATDVVGTIPLACATPGSCIPTDGNTLLHCTPDTDWSGGLRCSTGGNWTTNGTITLSSARYNWPYQTTKLDREGAGPFTDANYDKLDPANTGNDVLDFTGDFTCRGVMTPTDVSGSPVWFSDGVNAGKGYYAQLVPTAATITFWNNPANQAISTANAPIINGLNIVSFGRNGTAGFIKLNAGTTATNANVPIAAATTTAAFLGRFTSVGSSFPGVIHEFQCTTAPFVEAIETNVHRRFFGMMTNLGYTPVSVTNTTVRSQVSDGRLTYAPPNTLRHGWGTSDYSNVGVGSVYEGATTNADIFSEQLNNGAAGQWIATNTTVTADQGVFADGQTNMELVNTTVVGGRIMYAATTASSTTFVGSGWFRADAATKVGTTGVFCGGVLTVTACTCLRDDGGACTADGTVDTNQSCIAYGTFDTTKPVRMWAMATCSAATTTPSHFFAGGRYANAAAQLYIGGAQLEIGPAASTYCGPTLAVTKTCNADVVTMPNPLRPPGNDWTNSVLWGEQVDNAAWLLSAGALTVTPNLALGPDGSMSMDKLDNTAGTTNSYRYQTVTTASSTTFTSSAWAKSDAVTDTVTVIAQCPTNVTTCTCETSDGSACTTSTAVAVVCSATATVGTTPVRVSAHTTCTAATTNPIIGLYPGTQYVTKGTAYFFGAQITPGLVTLNYCGPTLAASLTCGPGGAIGKTRTNVNNYNWQLDKTGAGAWTRFQLNTVTPDAIAGPTSVPVGAGDLVIENNANNAHGVLAANYTATAAPWTMSAYAKAGTRTWAALSPDSGTHVCYFNLATCAPGSNVGPGVVTSNAADTVDNGWCRLRCTTTLGAGAQQPQVLLATADTVSSYIGDNASGAYFTGIQVELGSEATPPCGETFNASKTCGPKQSWCVRVKKATPLNGRSWTDAAANRYLWGMGTPGNANSIGCYASNGGGILLGVWDGYAVAGTQTVAHGFAAGSDHTMILCTNDVSGSSITLDSTTTAGTISNKVASMPGTVQFANASGGVGFNGTVEAYDFCNAGTIAECGW